MNEENESDSSSGQLYSDDENVEEDETTLVFDVVGEKVDLNETQFKCYSLTNFSGMSSMYYYFWVGDNFRCARPPVVDNPERTFSCNVTERNWLSQVFASIPEERRSKLVVRFE